MNAHRERASLLMQQGRLDLAVQEFGRALLEDPTDSVAHACKALCLCDLDKYDEAQQAAAEAIRTGPDSALGHYALAAIALARDRLPEARRSAAEAIRLDPDDATNFALMARVLFAGGRWEEARQAAEAGLRIDPAEVQCLNMHSLALQQLGRPGDARQVVETALARDPENASTQAVAGWAALKAGDSRKALEHFKEALRIDPTLEHARSGIVESIKARNILYAMMLKYFFWMGRLSGKAQWAAVLGGVVGFRILRQVAKSNPALAVWIQPVLGLYILFVFLTWTAEPLSNLLLRLHPLGRLALSREEVVASNWVGLCILGAACAFAWWLVTKDEAALAATAGALFFTIPVAAVFSCAPGWRRRTAATYAAALGAVGITTVALWLMHLEGAAKAAMGVLAIVFIIGVLAGPWVANVLIAGSSRRS